MGHARCLNVRCHHVTVSSLPAATHRNIKDPFVRCQDRGRGAEGGCYQKAVERVVMHRQFGWAIPPIMRWRSPKATSTTTAASSCSPADMKPYGSGADVDAAWGPVLPPDAYYTGRPGHTPMPSRCGTRQARSATAWPASGVDATGSHWSAQFGGLGYDGDLDLYTVSGMVGEAFGYLPGAELLLTGWPVPRPASPLPMLSRSGSRSWKPLRRRSPGAAARRQRQAPSRAGREVPATRSDSSVIIAMAEAPRAYPVNLIDEYDGTVLVASPDFPELTTFGAVRAHALAHAAGAFAEANRADMKPYRSGPDVDAPGKPVNTHTGASLYKKFALTAGRGAAAPLQEGGGFKAPASSVSNSSSGVRPTFWTICRS